MWPRLQMTCHPIPKGKGSPQSTGAQAVGCSLPAALPQMRFCQEPDKKVKIKKQIENKKYLLKKERKQKRKFWEKVKTHRPRRIKARDRSQMKGTSVTMSPSRWRHNVAAAPRAAPTAETGTSTATTNGLNYFKFFRYLWKFVNASILFPVKVNDLWRLMMVCDGSRWLVGNSQRKNEMKQERDSVIRRDDYGDYGLPMGMSWSIHGEEVPPNDACLFLGKPSLVGIHMDIQPMNIYSQH